MLSLRTLSDKATAMASDGVETVDVVISGCGMAGLATAAALGQSTYLSNHKVVLIDGQPKLPPTPKASEPFQNRVVALRPSATDFLDSIGAWEMIKGVRAKEWTNMKVWDSLSPSSIDFDTELVSRPYLGHIVENALVQGGLMNVLEKQGRVEVCLGTRVLAIEKPASADDLMTVKLDKGRTLKTRLLIGADGTKSLVRKSLGIKSIAWEYHHTGIVATMHIDPLSLSPNDQNNQTAWQRFLPSGTVAVLPLSSKVSSLVWSTYPKIAEELMSLSDDDFVEALNTALSAQPDDSLPFAYGPMTNAAHRPGIMPPAPPPTVLSLEANSRTTFPFGFSNCRNYYAQRTALVADAAHRTHPLAGQGINMGLADAEDLANRIIHEAYCGLDIGSQTMLEGYSQSRQRGNWPLMAGMDSLNRLYATDFSPIVWLRSMGLKATNSMPFVKRQLLKAGMGY